MSYKISVSKSGYSAFSTNPNNFIFHSDYNTFKIISSNSFSFNIPYGGYQEYPTGVVNHNLNYIPFVIAFCKYNNGRVGLVGSLATEIFPTKTVSITNLGVDSSAIYFYTVNNTNSNYPIVIRYYIFETPAVL
jgi:hypothetical protein